jgi:hypothetical protein
MWSIDRVGAMKRRKEEACRVQDKATDRGKLKRYPNLAGALAELAALSTKRSKLQLPRSTLLGWLLILPPGPSFSS